MLYLGKFLSIINLHKKKKTKYAIEYTRTITTVVSFCNEYLGYVCFFFIVWLVATTNNEFLTVIIFKIHTIIEFKSLTQLGIDRIYR